jgi:hypothetical protein
MIGLQSGRRKAARRAHIPIPWRAKDPSKPDRKAMKKQMQLFCWQGCMAALLLCAVPRPGAALLPESQWTNDAAYRDSEVLFRHDGFAQVDVLIDTAVLQTLLSRTDSNAANADEYFPCTVVYHSDRIASETIENAGFRLKGNTSRGSSLPSFKLKFNEFIPGRDVHGLKRLNLAGESNDTESN